MGSVVRAKRGLDGGNAVLDRACCDVHVVGYLSIRHALHKIPRHTLH